MASPSQPYHIFQDEEELQNKATGSELVRKQDKELCCGSSQLEIEREETSISAFSDQQGGYISLFTEHVHVRLTVTSEGENDELQYFARVSQRLRVIVWSLPELEASDSSSSLTCKQCCIGSLDPCSCKCRPVNGLPTWQCIKDWGVEAVRAYLFPLFSKHFKQLVSLVELLTAITMIAVALPTFVNEYKNGYVPPTDIVRLSISLLSIVLAAIGGIFTWRKCALCNAIKCSDKPHIRKRKRPKFDGEIFNDAPKPVQSKRSVGEKCEKYLIDIVRLLLAEAVTYPTLICNVIDNASRRTYQGLPSEKLAFARFILSAIWLIVHVYLIRLIIIGGTVVHLERVRRGYGVVTKYYDHNETTEPSHVEKAWVDPDGRLRAFRGMILEIFFLVHVFGQMLTQGLMIGAIWSKVECENPEQANTMYLSPFTWVMVVLGFLLPIAGTFTFFIPTYFWAQEFPSDFIIGMLTSLKKRGLLCITRLSEETHIIIKKLDSLLNRIGDSQEKIDNSEKRSFLRKLFYPFFSPLLVFFACIYDVVLLSFAVFFFFGQLGISDNKPYIVCPFPLNITGLEPRNITQEDVMEIVRNEVDSVGLDAGTRGWLLYYLVGVILVNVANVIVVLIGLLWMVIVPIFGQVIVLLILLIGSIYYFILKPFKKYFIDPCCETKSDSSPL